MARYDRGFLNTYLTDLCSLHFAKMHIDNIIDEKKWQIERLQQGVTIEAPKAPKYESTMGCFSAFLIILGAFMSLGVGIGVLSGNYPSDWPAILPILGFIIGVLMLFFPIRAAVEVKRENDAIRNAYEFALTKYEEQCREARKMNADARALVPKVVEQVRFYEQEADTVSKLLEQAYNVNVIPVRYRDMYAAVYLHDYFSNSREDDLAMALNTYVLEQIKDRLDQIIEMQAEIILNQRVQTALQYKTMEEQRKFAASMERKVDQLNATVEEQNQYLNMIEANTSATAYFMAASYFKD